MNNNNHTPSVFKLHNINIHLDLAAAAFNTYFSNLVERLNMEYANTWLKTAILFDINLIPDGFPEIITIPITEVGMKGASLMRRNSSSHDRISNKILKLCREYLGRPLTHIYNRSLIPGKFPDSLKYSIVNQLFQSGEKSQLSNCRPVSLLTRFSKIFEMLMIESMFT